MVTEHELNRAIDDLYPKPKNKKHVDANASTRTELKALVQTEPSKASAKLSRVIDGLTQEWVSLACACVYLNCTRQTLFNNRSEWGGNLYSEWDQVNHTNSPNGKLVYRLAWLKEIAKLRKAESAERQEWKEARAEGPFVFKTLQDFNRAVKLLLNDDGVIQKILLPGLSPAQRKMLKDAGFFETQMPFIHALTSHAWADLEEQEKWIAVLRQAMDEASAKLTQQVAFSTRLKLEEALPEAEAKRGPRPL